MGAMTRVSWLAVCLASVLAVTGCADRHILTLDPDEIDASACADLSPIHVEDLGVERSDCNLLGATLVFPDGTEVPMEKKAGGGGFQSSAMPLIYSFTYVGDYGIVAGQTLVECGQTKIWGGSEAKKRVLHAFGEQWPCPAEG